MSTSLALPGNSWRTKSPRSLTSEARAGCRKSVLDLAAALYHAPRRRASWWSVFPRSLDQMMLKGERHGLGATAHAELGQYTAYVELRGGAANHKSIGYLGVVQSLDQQRQHLALAVGEVVTRACRPRCGVNQSLGGLRSQCRASCFGSSNRIGQLVGRDVLEQVADGSSL